jgi:hypothetical protein
MRGFTHKKYLEGSECGKILVRFWKLAEITERYRVIEGPAVA